MVGSSGCSVAIPGRRTRGYFFPCPRLMVSGMDLVMGGAGGVESLLLNGAGLWGCPVAMTGRRTRGGSSICWRSMISVIDLGLRMIFERLNAVSEPSV
jgi:hypothetical protein